MSTSSLVPSPNSTRPYLVRALYEWCTDNGYTPYIAAFVDDTVQVPREYVKNNEIVLNISMDATSSLKLGNDFIEFKARFAGSARVISVPLDRVIAIYARENGQGMAFPMPASLAARGMPESGVASNTAPNIAPAVVHVVQPPANPSKDTAEDVHSKVVQLVPVLPGDEGVPHDEPPKPSGGARPSLKRVK
jgi:stringent starvation protein B